MCPFLIKQNVSAVNVNGDSFVHLKDSVISDWELSDFIRGKVAEGSEHYRDRFEPLLEYEAHSYRVKATMAEGSRIDDAGEVAPPWDDYVGLHPTEIQQRMRDADLEKVKQAKRYERAGMNRDLIVDFVHPAEREPFANYNVMSIREICDKLAILSPPAVADAITYEKAHKGRPAIVEFDKETYEAPPADETTPAGITA